MSNKTNLLVDTAILGAFLVAMEPRLTGVAVHEWLALALAGTIVVHLLLHWKWIVQVTARFFQKLLHQSRLQYVVDLLLMVAFVAVMLSGLLISRTVLPFFGIPEQRGFVWRQVHSPSANVGLGLMALHFALHWNWVVGTVKRYVVAPVIRLVVRLAHAGRRAVDEKAGAVEA